MSYILQALAQSERERRDADAPDLARVFDVETPTATGRRRRTLIFGVLLLLVNAAVIAALILFGDFQFGGKASTSTAAVTDIALESAPIPESVPAPQQETTLIKLPAQPINTAPSTPESMPIYNTPANDAATPKDTTTQNTSLEAEPAADINKTVTQDIPIEDPAIAELPIIEPKPNVDKPAKVASQQQVQKPEFTGIERVSTLPGIDMSVHAYSDKVAERFVFINGQEYNEGDTLTAEGAKLTAITPDGIVVDFGNRRVLLSRIR